MACNHKRFRPSLWKPNIIRIFLDDVESDVRTEAGDDAASVVEGFSNYGSL